MAGWRAGLGPLRLACSLMLVACLTSTGARLLPLEASRAEEELNLRPIFGVLSQGGDPAPEGHSYIASSYIKFLESAGARVVPILHDMTPAEITRRFEAVNGVLIPGGSQDLRPGHPYYDSAELLFKLALAANDKGDYFPVHGTCLGFEALAIIASGNHSILSRFSAENLPGALFPTDTAEKSRFFSGMPARVFDHLTTRPYAMENHANGLAWTAIDQNPKLKSFFDVLTLSADRGGAVYVSTMEARDYPITAVQWHPEKNAFEWTPEKAIPHDPEAIEVTQEVANYLVNQARRSRHRPASREEEEDLLIYNWAPSYTGKRSYEGEEVDFDESYFFPDAKTYAAQLAERRAARSRRAAVRPGWVAQRAQGAGDAALAREE